ncbi:hypothetical protein [Pontibacter sp. G13]|uniref:hypothetical protein n=1 Tax=Pontibacter sp. G13 TaxID=3074898 RepID=UPI0028894753|nr:hypothetical protein [Pontibacter sp. G13]WNJ17177.1 hypothetical protein RJD25_20160 [Pontibacter sp. G13]
MTKLLHASCFRNCSVLWLLIWGLPLYTFSQSSPPPKDWYQKGLRVELDTTGKRFVKFGMMVQGWTRYYENNPGTGDGIGEEQAAQWDFGMRRMRFTATAQLYPRWVFYFQAGVNNQSFLGQNPPWFFHDAWGKYLLARQPEFRMSLGAGLHFWNGISRMSSSSVLRLLTVDFPSFNFINLGRSDQAGRQFGWFTQGNVSRLTYQLSVNKPFQFGDLDNVLPGGRAQDIPTDSWSTAGYLAWQFGEEEHLLTPFATTNYLGTKRMINLGLGWYYQPNASGTIAEAGGELEEADHFVWALDLMVDVPIGEDGMAASFYAMNYFVDYGPNYYRSSGTMNVGQPAVGFMGEMAVQGIGNAEDFSGTGNIFYAQGGWLSPRSWLGKAGQIQPFGAIHWKSLDYLDDASIRWDVGANWLIDGHHLKISGQYSSRALFLEENGRRNFWQRRGTFILQTMFSL